MRTWVAIATFALVGVCFASNLPAPTPAKQTGEKQESATENNKNPNPEIATAFNRVMEHLSTFRSEYQAYVDRKHEKEKAHHDFWIALGTWMLFVVTLGLAIYTAKLWGSTKTIARDAKETSVRELRPYFGLEAIEFVGGIIGNANGWVGRSPMKTLLSIKIKNYGRTPGYSMMVFVKPVFAPFPVDTAQLPHIPDFGEPVLTGQMLCPDQTHVIEFRNNEGFGPDQRGTKLYGMIVYSDPITERTQHLDFCRQYEGEDIFVPSGPFNKEWSSDKK